MRVRILTSAFEDLTFGRAFYEAQGQGLGDYFFDSVFSEIDSLAPVHRMIDVADERPRGSHASHTKNPIALHDVFFRVGGAGAGQTEGNLEINSNDTIVDHTWIWRADHGAGR